MGFFSSSSQTAATPSGIPPKRTQRAACWEGRDAFFACLDMHGIVDSIKEADNARKVCGAEETMFERECVGSWVEYFKKRRVMEHNREQMLKNLKAEGAKTVDMPNTVDQAQKEP